MFVEIRSICVATEKFLSKWRNREMEKRKVTVLSYFVRLLMSADKNLYTDITGMSYEKE